MPTLRSINKMQLEIQRTGTLQIISIWGFFPRFWGFSFKKNTDAEQALPALPLPSQCGGSASQRNACCAPGPALPSRPRGGSTPLLGAQTAPAEQSGTQRAALLVGPQTLLLSGSQECFLRNPFVCFFQGNKMHKRSITSFSEWTASFWKPFSPLLFTRRKTGPEGKAFCTEGIAAERGRSAAAMQSRSEGRGCAAATHSRGELSGPIAVRTRPRGTARAPTCTAGSSTNPHFF